MKIRLDVVKLNRLYQVLLKRNLSRKLQFPYSIILYPEILNRYMYMIILNSIWETRRPDKRNSPCRKLNLILRDSHIFYKAMTTLHPMDSQGLWLFPSLQYQYLLTECIPNTGLLFYNAKYSILHICDYFHKAQSCWKFELCSTGQQTIKDWNLRSVMFEQWELLLYYMEF